MRRCDYCKAPTPGAGFLGRPWPGRSAREYCCYGCLALGEQDCQESCSPGAADAPKSGLFDGGAARLAVGLLIAMQSMVASLGVNLSDPGRDVKLWVHAAVGLATLIVVALLGFPLFRAATRELLRLRITIESLFVVTLIGAGVASVQSMVSGEGPIYFEVISVLLVVYTIGRNGRCEVAGGSRRFVAAVGWCSQ